MHDATAWGPQHLPPWFEHPKPVREFQRGLFSRQLPEVLTSLSVSIDDLGRWHERGWVSFGPGRVSAIEQWDADEIRFVRDVVRSGLTDAHVDRLFSELPRPMNFDADAVAYSFGLGWVVAKQPSRHDEVIEAHLDEWLQDLADAEDTLRLSELRDRITGLLASLAGPNSEKSA